MWSLGNECVGFLKELREDREMQSKAKTVKEYLASLPADRREAIAAVRAVVLKSLPKGYEEGMQYGMIGYHVPHSVFPAGYHCDPEQPLPFAGLASQKNHMAIYLMCVYGDAEHEAWFRKAWSKTGKRLDMGKSCVRFKKLEDVALEVIGEAVRRVPVKKFVAHYESVLESMGKGPKKSGASKTAKNKTTRRPVVKRPKKKTVKSTAKRKR